MGFIQTLNSHTEQYSRDKNTGLFAQASVQHLLVSRVDFWDFGGGTIADVSAPFIGHFKHVVKYSLYRFVWAVLMFFCKFPCTEILNISCRITRIRKN